MSAGASLIRCERYNEGIGERWIVARLRTLEQVTGNVAKNVIIRVENLDHSSVSDRSGRHRRRARTANGSAYRKSIRTDDAICRHSVYAPRRMTGFLRGRPLRRSSAFVNPWVVRRMGCSRKSRLLEPPPHPTSNPQLVSTEVLETEVTRATKAGIKAKILMV